MRDYMTEMNDLLDTRVPESDYIAGVVAAEIVNELRDSDPDLLYGWLSEMAVIVMTDTISTRSNSDRARRRHFASASAFAAAAASFATSGDPTSFSPFREQFVVNTSNLRRIVADMTSDDHTFVASRYTQTANKAQMEAAFHSAVAKRIGPGQTTSDVMDEETYQKLHDSIAGPPPPATT